MKNLIYNHIVKQVTIDGYKVVLEHASKGALILDVGIGNGLMIKHYHAIIKRKKIKIIGIDINRVYLKHCANLIEHYGLQDNFKLVANSIENFLPPEKQSFDCIVFSMSLMLLKDKQQDIIESVKNWMKPDGRIIFSQVEFEKNNKFLNFIKPKLKYLTTIDFGEIIYRDEFLSFLESNSLRVIENISRNKNFFKGKHRITMTGHN